MADPLVRRGNATTQAPKTSAKASSEEIQYEKRQLRIRTKDLSALLRIAETATQSLDTDKILNDTLNESLGFLGFDVGFIRILDPETRTMVVRVARGLSSPEFLSTEIPVDSSQLSPSKIVYDTKEAYIAPDIRKDSLYRSRTMEREGVISTAAAPIMSKNRVLGVIVVGSRKFHRFAKRDISLLKAFGSQLGAALENAQLYDEVMQGKSYIENLVENAADGIVCTDLNDRILTWNRGAEVLFGYSKEEVVGEHLSILLPPERLHELEETRAKVHISGALRDIEVRSKRKDGIMIYLSLSVSPIRDAKGKIVGLLRVAKDISDKKRLERRLKELDRMKSDFVSNVSHELRTPLTAIKGSVDNMLDGITGPFNEKQTRYLARIKANADRLGRLINDLLDLSRIEAGKINLRPVYLSVPLLAREVADVLRPIAAEKLITLEVTSSDESLKAWADRDKVTQVLMNLVGNALKFTPTDGRVTIAIDRNEAEWVKISVADTGAGIPSQEADKIFDKFYQIVEPNNRKTKGTGLGLTICRVLVEMHGGAIWVNSGLNQGSTFSFTLPVRQPLELEARGE